MRSLRSFLRWLILPPKRAAGIPTNGGSAKPAVYAVTRDGGLLTPGTAITGRISSSCPPGVVWVAWDGLTRLPRESRRIVRISSGGGMAEAGASGERRLRAV